MLVLKIAPVFLVVLVVGAEKKIELQDIENDNLKSEKEKDIETSEPRSESLPLEFLKNGLLRYFEAPTHTQQPQQPRYVPQYAVTEPPERPVGPSPKTQYGSPSAQQAMVGYLSNVPMQIYLVPQYYNDQSEQGVSSPGVQYAAPSMTRIAYPTGPESGQTQTNYIEVPAYVTPTGKSLVQPYSSPVAYVTYSPQPTAAPTPATAVAPILVPVVQYPTAIVAPPVAPKGYYQSQHYETNAVDDTNDNDEDAQKQYVTQTDPPYSKPTVEYPRYYSSRTPVRDDFRHSTVSELPPPNPLLLKGPPPHLSHIPKALPMYRPLSKPVYAGASVISTAYTPRPLDAYGVPYRRRPNSLLDSYIPSALQLEYLKRGYSKDPLAIYEALSGARHFGHSPVSPRHYERGFLPNQMYHTAAGGVTYGHYKRTPKLDKTTQ
ncbi:hypothetical protein ACJJTC_009477 [Scirpophaga incertulas]